MISSGSLRSTRKCVSIPSKDSGPQGSLAGG